MPDHLRNEHARAEDPSGRHTEPHLRFYFLALNKGTGHCVQIEEWYTGFIFVSRSRVDLVDACRSALPLHVLGALLAEVSDSRRRNERRVIRSTSLSGLVQRIVDLENALRARKRLAGGSIRRLGRLARHAGLQDKDHVRACKAIDEAVGCFEFTVQPVTPGRVPAKGWAIIATISRPRCESWGCIDQFKDPGNTQSLKRTAWSQAQGAA